jgi:hypothetical protein
MLNCSIYSRQFVGDKASGRITHMPFHPGDFLFFGFAEDLTNLFDISLAVEPESSRWFDIHGRPAGVFDWFAHAHCRFFPEQHIWISFLRKFLDIPLRDRLDLDHACLIHDLPGQVNNLVVLDQAQWSFQMPKYTLRQYTMPHYEWDGLLRHQVWRQRYGELSAGQPHRGLTYDSRMRLIFHDSRVARRIQQRAPRAFSYIQKRLRKQQLFP